jgi:hypothetical protein
LTRADHWGMPRPQPTIAGLQTSPLSFGGKAKALPPNKFHPSPSSSPRFDPRFESGTFAHQPQKKFKKPPQTDDIENTISQLWPVCEQATGAIDRIRGPSQRGYRMRAARGQTKGQ